jgi:hypothetical protein
MLYFEGGLKNPQFRKEELRKEGANNTYKSIALVMFTNLPSSGEIFVSLSVSHFIKPKPAQFAQSLWFGL